MESMILSPRLTLAAEMVPPGARLADIGTDHGKLPISLILNNKIDSAIASDIRRGPLQHARKNALEHGVTKICFILGMGLQEISPDDCDTISILGMGCETICEILKASPWTKEGNHRLLLQAMTAIPHLHKFLANNGYWVINERICREDTKYYTIIEVFGGHTPKDLPQERCLFSEALLSDPLAKEYLSNLLKREEKILIGIKKSNTVLHENVALHEKMIQVLTTAREMVK